MTSADACDLRVVRNLFTLDVQESARKLIDDPLYLKVFWGAFGSLRYQSEIIQFDDEECRRLLTCHDYRDCPLPYFINVIVDLFGDALLQNAHETGILRNNGYDVFLTDYTLFLIERLFGQCDLPSIFSSWVLSPPTEPHLGGQGLVPLSRLAIASHSASGDLQKQFDLGKLEGRLGLMGWTLRWKSSVLGDFSLPESLIRWLELPGLTTKFAQEAGITRYHEALYFENAAHSRLYPLSKLEGALAWSAWIMRYGSRVGCFEMPAWVWRSLSTCIGRVDGVDVDRLALSLWWLEKLTDGLTTNFELEKMRPFLHTLPKLLKDVQGRWDHATGLNTIKL